jgi:hypothetical protein
MVEHDRFITNIRLTDIKDTIAEILDYEYRTGYVRNSSYLSP